MQVTVLSLSLCYQQKPKTPVKNRKERVARSLGLRTQKNLPNRRKTLCIHITKPEKKSNVKERGGEQREQAGAGGGGGEGDKSYEKKKTHKKALHTKINTVTGKEKTKEKGERESKKVEHNEEREGEREGEKERNTILKKGKQLTERERERHLQGRLNTTHQWSRNR